jgi:uncharacterized C2H2 Zn-finger protein
MNFLRNKKNDCNECDEKFSDHEDLVKHVRKIHHHTIVKCTECGMEFIHEKHRLEHFRKEHKEKKARNRTEKNLFKHKGFFKT